MSGYELVSVRKVCVVLSMTDKKNPCELHHNNLKVHFTLTLCALTS